MINITGKLNGIEFTVKPESFRGRKLDREIRAEMKAWQDKNNKKFLQWSEEYGDAAAEGKETPEPPEFSYWEEDVEFRASRAKKMAENAMEFKGKIPNGFWERDDLQIGVIKAAWDFFVGNRPIPNDMYLK